MEPQNKQKRALSLINCGLVGWDDVRDRVHGAPPTFKPSSASTAAGHTRSRSKHEDNDDNDDPVETVEELNLHANELRDLNAQRTWKTLTTLNVSSNCISDVNEHHFNWFPSLENLDLSTNQIDAIHGFGQQTTKTLRTLKLAYNRLTSLSWLHGFYNHSQLRSLDLRGNSISSLQELQWLSGLTCLETVRFSDSQGTVNSKNPVCNSGTVYWAALLTFCPSLSNIDGIPVDKLQHCKSEEYVSVLVNELKKAAEHSEAEETYTSGTAGADNRSTLPQDISIPNLNRDLVRPDWIPTPHIDRVRHRYRKKALELTDASKSSGNVRNAHWYHQYLHNQSNSSRSTRANDNAATVDLVQPRVRDQSLSIHVNVEGLHSRLRPQGHRNEVSVVGATESNESQCQRITGLTSEAETSSSSQPRQLTQSTRTDQNQPIHLGVENINSKLKQQRHMNEVDIATCVTWNPFSSSIVPVTSYDGTPRDSSDWLTHMATQLEMELYKEQSSEMHAYCEMTDAISQASGRLRQHPEPNLDAMSMLQCARIVTSAVILGLYNTNQFKDDFRFCWDALEDDILSTSTSKFKRWSRVFLRILTACAFHIPDIVPEWKRCHRRLEMMNEDLLSSRAEILSLRQKLNEATQKEQQVNKRQTLLQDEINSLKLQLESRPTTADLESIKLQYSDISEDLERAQKHTEALKSELKETKKEKESTEHDMKSLKETLAANEQDLSSLRARVSELTSECDKLRTINENTHKGFLQEAAQATSKANDAMEKLEKARQQIAEKDEKLTARDTEINSLKEETSQWQMQYENVIQQYENKLRDIEQEWEEKIESQASIAEEEVRRGFSSVATLKESLRHALEEGERRKKLLKQTYQQKREAEEQLHSARQELQTSQSRVCELQEQLQITKNSHKHLVDKAKSEHMDRLKQLEESNKQREREVSDLQKRLEETQRALNSCRDQERSALEELRAKTKTLDEKNQTIKYLKSDLQEQYRSSDRKIMELEREIDTLRERNQTLEKQKQKAEHRAHNAEIEGQFARQFNEQLEKLVRELRAEESPNEQLSQKLAQKEQALKYVEGEVRDLQEKMNSREHRQREEINKLEEEKKTLKESEQTLKRQLSEQEKISKELRLKVKHLEQKSQKSQKRVETTEAELQVLLRELDKERAKNKEYMSNVQRAFQQLQHVTGNDLMGTGQQSLQSLGYQLDEDEAKQCI